MKKTIVDMGIISAVFHYEIKDEVAFIHRLEIGGANAVDFPLTDKWDSENFSKLLSNKIGMRVVVECND